MKNQTLILTGTPEVLEEFVSWLNDYGMGGFLSHLAVTKNVYSNPEYKENEINFNLPIVIQLLESTHLEIFNSLSAPVKRTSKHDIYNIELDGVTDEWVEEDKRWPKKPWELIRKNYKHYFC